MDSHPLGLRGLIGMLSVLIVLVAPAWPAGAAPSESSGALERNASWILQTSSLEAIGVRARLSSPELRRAANKHRSVPIWVVMAGLGLSLPLMVPRSRLTLMAGRPHLGGVWPLALPRGPPLFQFS